MEDTTRAAWDHIMAHTELLERKKFGFFAAMDKARQSSEDIDPEEIISELASMVVHRFQRENNMDKSATIKAIAEECAAEMGEEQ